MVPPRVVRMLDVISPPPMPEPLVRSYSGQPVKPGLFLMIRGSRLTMSAIEVIVDGSTYEAAVDSAYFPDLALTSSRATTGFGAVALAVRLTMGVYARVSVLCRSRS